jgi:archaellum component FlaC
MSDDIVARLREIEESAYGLGASLTQVRKVAGKAADRIEQLERRERAVKAAVDAIKEDADAQA